MAKIISLILFLFSVSFIIAQSTPIQGNKFKLEGKLISKPKLSPHCGIFAWGTVLEFKIIKYSDKTYTKDSITIIFQCPEFYGDSFFESEKTYSITISNTNEAPFKWLIYNPELLNKYKEKFWAIEAKKIN